VSGESRSSDGGYRGPFGLFPVPYSKAVFNFHWFNFYNGICFQIILGAPIVLLAKYLGANSVTLGIIESFTPLMTTLQLPAARHLGKYSYRSFTLMGWGSRSIFIATAAIIPLLSFASRETKLGLLLASLFFFNLIRGISSAAFLPWITSIIPSTMRGRYIGVDHSFVYTGSLVTMVISALLMRGEIQPWRYSLVLWVSVAGAVISLLYLRLIPDARQSETVASSERLPIRTMLALRPFRNSILFSLLFTTVTGGLSVFPVEYLRQQAHFSPSTILALSAATFFAPLLILQALGRVVDVLGSITVIRWAVLFFGTVLAFWFAMSAGLIRPDWKMVLILNFTGGIGLAAFNLANLHLGMSVVPDSGKNHYFALTTVITSLCLGLVPITWGWILDALGGLDVVLGPFHLRRHSIYFLGITLLCFAALLMTRILVQPKGHREIEAV
jgi:MFS family permease